MKTNIRQLILINFKGIRNLTIDFNQDIQDIMGDNGTGKTSIFDAFTWLIFGKDSQDRKDFDIKTLDEFNRVIEKLEHAVHGIIEVDGQEIKLSRILREKWIKSRGDEVPTFQGNETTYMIDDIPCTMAEYQKRISEITPEQQFKLLTSPWFFNSLPWKERRTMLTSIANIPDDNAIFDMITTEKNAEIIAEIRKTLANGATIDKLKQKYAFEKGKLKDELKLIPARIDEVERSKPEIFDYAKLEKELSIKEQKLQGVNAAIKDKSKLVEQEVQERASLINQKYQISAKMQEVKNNAQAELDQQKRNDEQKPTELRDVIGRGERRVQELINDLNRETDNKKRYQDEIDSLKHDNINLGKDYDAVNAMQFSFDTESGICSHCGQSLPMNQVESIRKAAQEKFKETKINDINRINAMGVANKNRIEFLSGELVKIKNSISEIEKSIETGNQFVNEKKLELENLTSVKATIATIDEYLATNDQYNALKKEHDSIETPEIVPADTESLELEAKEIISEIDALKNQISTRNQIESANKRIEELKQQEQTFSQQIASYEKIEFQIDQFQKEKSSAIERKVNSMFPEHIKFKLFNQLINGSEEECCEALINGVPFSGASNAERIKAGISIINVFSDHMQMFCPIFVDNAEAANILPATQSQLIRLVVTLDKQMIIKG